jgi:predicted ATPase
MLSLPDFTFRSTLFETRTAILYRGVRGSDGRAVVAKVMRNPHPTRSELARFRNQFALLRSLDSPHVVSALALEPSGNGLALVMDDLGDRSARSLVGERLSLKPFLTVAVAMAGALEGIHRQRVVHKDIKPDHFFLDESDQQAKLVDFAIAVRLSPGAIRGVNATQLEGTLTHISPEQTGYMNRLVDERSDLYSFGVTLYELLTGAPPFAASDPLELVHCHVAQTPRAPIDVRPDIPRVVSDLVLKLLSKTAEDRYQSASGVKADLLSCLEMACAGGAVTEFPLGRSDTDGEIHVPQKLYGREEATEKLLAAVDRVQRGAVELVLISGPPGIGKSALVNQIHKAIVLRGHLVAGKFDQLGSTPYSAIAQACRELIRAVLTEPPGRIATWRSKLEVALGANAQLIVDLVPELALVISAKTSVANVGPAEAQNRFELAFQNFLGTFTSSEHPLVLFLDDLQWADRGSLRLIHAALTTASKAHLLVVGAYRDNEGAEPDPLRLALDDLRSAGVPSTHIRLAALGQPEVEQFLGDALGRAGSETSSLAAMMLRSTDGNPFFLGQLLMVLHQDGLLVFDAAARKWTWDASRLEARVATDNVIDIMIHKIKRLPGQTQAALRIAACVGHTFDRDALARVAQRAPAEIESDLEHAVHEGLLVTLDVSNDNEASAPTDVRYRFLHDRVQQAVYGLIDDRDKQEMHLQIGRMLLAMKGGDNPTAERSFALVQHLNLGSDLMSDEDERRALAKLNAVAGRKALDAAAHEMAATYLEKARSLLGIHGWEADQPTMHRAQLGLAECEFLRGRFDEAFQLLEPLEEHARSVLDRVSARTLRTIVLTNLNRLPDAIACSVETARMLGVELPTDRSAVGPAIRAAFAAVRAALGGRSIESLADLPAMRDPEKLALVDVLSKTIPSAFQLRSAQLGVLIALTTMRLVLEHGNAPSSPFVFAGYGVAHLAITNDAATAFRYGEVGLELGRRPENRAMDGAAQFHVRRLPGTLDPSLIRERRLPAPRAGRQPRGGRLHSRRVLRVDRRVLPLLPRGRSARARRGSRRLQRPVPAHRRRDQREARRDAGPRSGDSARRDQRGDDG